MLEIQEVSSDIGEPQAFETDSQEEYWMPRLKGASPAGST